MEWHAPDNTGVRDSYVDRAAPGQSLFNRLVNGRLIPNVEKLKLGGTAFSDNLAYGSFAAVGRIVCNNHIIAELCEGSGRGAPYPVGATGNNYRPCCAH